MTNSDVPQSVIDTLSRGAVLTLILGIKIANDAGSFEAVLALCEDMVKQSKKSNRPKGPWAATEYRGFDFLEAKYPGCTKDMGRYLPDSYANADTPAEAKAKKAKAKS